MDKDILFFNSMDGRIDEGAGVVRGVSLITMGDARGHGLVVDSKTLDQLKDSLEKTPAPGIKAKLNHRSGVEAVFGYINNFQVKGNKLTGDLNMLQHHKDYNQTMEQIATMPGQIGLSVAFQGDKEPGKDGKVYARCKRIVSVDLVADPAANPDGMFETKVDKELHYMNEPEEANEQASVEELLESINDRLAGVEGFQGDLQEAIAEQFSNDDVEDGDYEDYDDYDDDDGDYEEEYDDGYADADYEEAEALEPVEYSSIDDALTYLEAKAEGALQAEQDFQDESVVADLEMKFEELKDANEELQFQNENLLEALEASGGVDPLPSSAIEHLFGTPSDENTFEFNVQAFSTETENPQEAIRNAVHNNPAAHRDYLVRQGILEN